MIFFIFLWVNINFNFERGIEHKFCHQYHYLEHQFGLVIDFILHNGNKQETLPGLSWVVRVILRAWKASAIVGIALTLARWIAGPIESHGICLFKFDDYSNGCVLVTGSSRWEQNLKFRSFSPLILCHSLVSLLSKWYLGFRMGKSGRNWGFRVFRFSANYLNIIIWHSHVPLEIIKFIKFTPLLPAQVPRVISVYSNWRRDLSGRWDRNWRIK